LRSEYPEFVKRGAEILNVGPDSAAKFRAYWDEHALPFPGLADPDHEVAKLYQQPFRLLKLGRMPMQLVVDRAGVIRYRHDGESMADIPQGSEILVVLDRFAGG
jgi:peroxiredoxin Q/BCP